MRRMFELPKGPRCPKGSSPWTQAPACSLRVSPQLSNEKSWLLLWVMLVAPSLSVLINKTG